jgi:hypothetical protein
MLPLAAPALPLDEAGKYVAGAYLVFVVLILIYVAIMAAKLQRIEKELSELARFAEQRVDRGRSPGRDPDTPASGNKPDDRSPGGSLEAGEVAGIYE